MTPKWWHIARCALTEHTILALLAVYVLFAGVLWFYQPVVDWVLAALRRG